MTKFLVVGFDKFGQFRFGPFDNYDSACTKLRDLQKNTDIKAEIRNRLEIDITSKQYKIINNLSTKENCHV